MLNVKAILTLAIVLSALCTGLSDGHGPGNGNWHGPGNGNWHGAGDGWHGPGIGDGHGPGDGNGHGPGNGNWHGPGNGNWHGRGDGNGHGQGNGNVNNAGLEVGFYQGKCKWFDVEAIVAGVVLDWFKTDASIVPALLRMQFHDCFVKGCDASILLDGTNSEKTAPPNFSVRGYNLIDAVKAKLESLCAGVVSCADIIVMATRDAVALGKGGRYDVETGRRDGTVSLAKNVNLPSPSISVSDSIKAFKVHGLSTTDMVYLLGGHTVGITHCSLFQSRLYNFKNTGGSDPNMDPDLLNALKTRCPQNATSNNIVDLDQNPLSSNTVDNSFFRQIVKKRGILQIDQDLALDTLTKQTVESIASGFDFMNKFGEAMVKLGRVDVLTGNQGEIRHFCNVTNSKPSNSNTKTDLPLIGGVPIIHV